MIDTGSRVVSEPGGALRLREVVPGDLLRLHRWRMEPTARVMFRDDRPVPYMSHLTFVSRYLRPDCSDRWFVIEAEGHPIGAIALYGFSADGTEAEWGRFVITPEKRGQGWGRRALTLLVEHARELGVRRLRCAVLAGKPGGEALYRSLGFGDAGREEVGGRLFLRLEAVLDPPRERIEPIE